MKKFLKEFKDFAMKGNVLDLAVGVIIGAAFKDIVTSLTDNFINPILQFITRAHPNWYTLNEIGGFASAFITAVINFIIMAFILFLIVKLFNSLGKIGKKPEAPKAPTTKVCPFCKTEINIEASRCPHCTSEQPSEEK
ncbi:MAG: large conductance mechanosensitive channel protein MscL [Ruminococcaceae bacterium]|nr:large conductance mechanosensitive channel protein MscL [Oscillospiraceae bacterium]